MIRHVSFGEGGYGETEAAIASLVGAADSSAKPVPDTTPTQVARRPSPTSATSGSTRRGTSARRVRPTRLATYTAPRSLPRELVRVRGSWRVERRADRRRARTRRSRSTSTPSDVYLVLGGHGRVRCHVTGKPATNVDVDVVPPLHAAQLGRDHRRRPARPALHARRPGLRVHVRLAAATGRRAAAGALVVLLALAQEARQLGGERVAGRKLALVVELVDAAARARRRRPRSPRPPRPPRSPAACRPRSPRRARSCRAGRRAASRAGRRAPSPRAATASAST